MLCWTGCSYRWWVHCFAVLWRVMAVQNDGGQSNLLWSAATETTPCDSCGVNQSWTQSDVHVDVYARLHPLVIVTTPWTKLREYLWLAYRLTLWCQTHLTEMKQCMYYKQLTMWPHQSQRRSTCSRSDGPHPSVNFDLWAQIHTCSSSN